MIERENPAFEATGAPAAERRTSNPPQIFKEQRNKVSLTVQDNPLSRAQSVATTDRPLRRSAGADLWWQRSPPPPAAASADTAPRDSSDMLPTVIVASAIILFKLFMLGLLIYSL